MYSRRGGTVGGARSRRSSRGLTSVTTRTCADIIAQQTTARAPSPPHGALDGTRQDHARRHRDSHITSDPELPVDLHPVDRPAGRMQYSHGQQPGGYGHQALQSVSECPKCVRSVRGHVSDGVRGHVSEVSEDMCPKCPKCPIRAPQDVLACPCAVNGGVRQGRVGLVDV